MAASQLFRKENEHPQAVLRFSSFLRNQVSWAELRCAELSWAELSCREAGGAGNLSWGSWKFRAQGARLGAGLEEAIARIFVTYCQACPRSQKEKVCYLIQVPREAQK